MPVGRRVRSGCGGAVRVRPRDGILSRFRRARGGRLYSGGPRTAASNTWTFCLTKMVRCAEPQHVVVIRRLARWVSTYSSETPFPVSVSRATLPFWSSPTRAIRAAESPMRRAATAALAALPTARTSMASSSGTCRRTHAQLAYLSLVHHFLRILEPDEAIRSYVADSDEVIFIGPSLSDDAVVSFSTCKRFAKL